MLLELLWTLTKATLAALVFCAVLMGIVSLATAGGYSCDFKLAILRQAAEDTVTELGPKNPTSYLLIQRLHDAQFRCEWDASRYRCQTPK